MVYNFLFLKRSIIALSAILLCLSTLMSQSNKKKELQKEYNNILREKLGKNFNNDQSYKNINLD